MDLPQLGFGTINEAITSLFTLAGGIAGLIFVVMLVVGGIQYLTSMGNEEAITKAKTLLVNAVIGIVIVGVAYAFGNWLLGKLLLGNESVVMISKILV